MKKTPVLCELTQRVILTLCEDVATPRALTVALMVRYGEWDQLVLLKTDPRFYETADSFFVDNLVTEILRKNADLPTSIDTEEKAVESFWESEARCYQSNRRLNPYLESRFHGFHPEGYDRQIGFILTLIRKEIRRLLGPVPLDLDGRFGPGATYGDVSLKSSILHKMTSVPTLTHEAWPLLSLWASTAWRRYSCHEGQLDIVRGNRFTTVPKDATKDRGICIEPSINLFYQLGVGSYMTSRLRCVGLDKVTAEERHRRVAREASSWRNFSTIDLSSASDTICKSLVKLLLPRSWFNLLDRLRSPSTFIKGKWVVLEKFSSMGNGFTFELETMIFASIASVACTLAGHKPVYGENVLVYGDDIIVPEDAARVLLSMLRFLGFVPNPRKTFVNGPFKESCGGDYFRGVPVRAYYLEKNPIEPQDWIGFANGLFDLGYNGHGRSPMLDPRLRRAWFRVLDNIPSGIRSCRGPAVLGDIVIHDEPSAWTIKYIDSVRYLRCYRSVGTRTIGLERIDEDSRLAVILYGIPRQERVIATVPSKDTPHPGVTPRGREHVLGHALRWTEYS